MVESGVQGKLVVSYSTFPLNCAVESRQNACKKQFSREGTLLKYFEDCPSLPN